MHYRFFGLEHLLEFFFFIIVDVRVGIGNGDVYGCFVRPFRGGNTGPTFEALRKNFLVAGSLQKWDTDAKLRKSSSPQCRSSVCPRCVGCQDCAFECRPPSVGPLLFLPSTLTHLPLLPAEGAFPVGATFSSATFTMQLDTFKETAKSLRSG